MEDEFSNLKVFKQAHALVLYVYKISQKFPKEELYSLTSQLRRAVVSIAANIVEGNTRRSKKEFIQFLYTSKGSLFEVKYFLLLAKDLNYLSEIEYRKLVVMGDEIGKMINGLLKYLKSKQMLDDRC